MSLMLAPSLLFRYFLRTLLYSVRLDDGRFDVVGLLYLPGAVGGYRASKRRSRSGSVKLLFMLLGRAGTSNRSRREVRTRGRGG